MGINYKALGIALINYLGSDELTELEKEKLKECDDCEFNQVKPVKPYLRPIIKQAKANTCTDCTCVIALKVKQNNENCKRWEKKNQEAQKRKK